MSIRVIGTGLAACVLCVAGGYIAGMNQTTPIDPSLPRIVQAGNVFQTHCPEDLWPIPMQTPRPKDRHHYDVSPPAFACVPRKAPAIRKKVWAADGMSYRIDESCPQGYAGVPFLGSGGGGGATLSCARTEWVEALEEQIGR